MTVTVVKCHCVKWSLPSSRRDGAEDWNGTEPEWITFKMHVDGVVCLPGGWRSLRAHTQTARRDWIQIRCLREVGLHGDEGLPRRPYPCASISPRQPYECAQDERRLQSCCRGEGVTRGCISCLLVSPSLFNWRSPWRQAWCLPVLDCGTSRERQSRTKITPGLELERGLNVQPPVCTHKLMLRFSTGSLLRNFSHLFCCVSVLICLH